MDAISKTTFQGGKIMIINHNLNAMNAHRQMGINTGSGAKSIEKLSSGYRINRAGDDAAGLAISEKMRGQIRGLNQASRNAQDSISLIQTAEGGLNESHAILQRMRELAVQSANDTNTTTDREALQNEVKQLTQEINRIANTTEFNTKKLLNGDLQGVAEAKDSVTELESTFENGTVKIGVISDGGKTATKTDVIRLNAVNVTSDGFAVFSVTTALGNISDGAVTIAMSAGTISVASGSDASTGMTISITAANKIKVGDTITISVVAREAAKTDSSKQVRAQIGANAGQELGIGIANMTSVGLGIAQTDGTALKISGQSEASASVKLINNALEKVSAERSKLGAFQNRLEHTIKNLDTSAENLQASEARIRDVDMAKEMMNFTKNNILTQAAQSMLAQANQAPQQVLQLLR